MDILPHRIGGRIIKDCEGVEVKKEGRKVSIVFCNLEMVGNFGRRNSGERTEDREQGIKECIECSQNL